MDKEIESLLKIREDFKNHIKKETDLSTILNTFLKGKVRRRYKDIVATSGINKEVVWGEGGAQSKRIAKFRNEGTPYIHVPSYLLT